MYTIKILNNKDFDRLPYENIHDSLGFADPKTNRAFVRWTGVPELNKYLMDHELDELLADESTHEDENGIRHKKFRQAAGNVARVAGPYIGAALAAPTGGLSIPAGAAIGGAIGGGAGSYLTPNKREFDFGRIAKGAAIGGATGYGTAKLTGGYGLPSEGNFFSRVGASAKSGFGLPTAGKNIANFFKNPLGAFSATAQANPATSQAAQAAQATQAGAGLTIPPSAYQNAAQLAAPTSQSFGVAAPSTITGGTPQGTLSKGIGGIFDFFKKNPMLTTGVALSGIGLGKQYPQVPELPSSITDLVSQIQGGGSPINQQALDRLSGIMGQEMEGLSATEEEEILRQIDDSYQQEKKALDSLYKNIRPGTDPTTDSAYQKDLNDLNDRYAKIRTSSLEQARRNIRTEYNATQLQAIQTSLGASTQDMQQLIQLAQLDVEMIAAQLNIDLQAAQDFKDTFMNLGSAFIAQGAGLNNPFGMFNLFGNMLGG